MVLVLVLESTSTVVDIYFVAKLGASAVATVGLTETYLFRLYAVAIGLSMGVTAIVARRVGELRGEKASLSTVQSILVAVLISIPFALAGIVWAKDLLHVIGGDGGFIDQGYRCMQWALGGNAVILLLFVINAIFRDAGDAAVVAIGV